MALVELVSHEIVKVPLQANNKPAVLRELVQILKAAGKIDDVERVLEAIDQREARGSTGLELGIAVPHAKTDEVKDLTMAIGISEQGVPFDALDGKPSKLFFLMLAPPDKTGPHLEALAEIAKLMKLKDFCRILKNAETAKEVVSMFQEYSLRA